MKKILFGFVSLFFILTSCSSDESDSGGNGNNNLTSINDIDGNSYNIVQIGTQIWTKENLNVSKYKNGDPIQQVTDPYTWQSLNTGAWCYYANNTANGTVYGKLYNWHAINDPRGLAPEGWHIPTDDDWTLLKDYLIANGYNYDGTVSGNKIAKSLASKNLWFDFSTYQNGAISNDLSLNNTSGFTGLPAGTRWADPTVSFNALGTNAVWWSSTSSSNNIAIRYGLVNTSVDLNRYGSSKQYGYSIRLIKD